MDEQVNEWAETLIEAGFEQAGELAVWLVENEVEPPRRKIELE